MKKIFRSFLVVVCFIAMTNVSFAQNVKVLAVKPLVYEKTVMVDDETRQMRSMAGGVGTGIVGGALVGGACGGLPGAIIGAILGVNGGGAAGSLAAISTAKVPKRVRVNGFMVTLDNGQTILTEQKYHKNQTIHIEKIVCDRFI